MKDFWEDRNVWSEYVGGEEVKRSLILLHRFKKHSINKFSMKN